MRLFAEWLRRTWPLLLGLVLCQPALSADSSPATEATPSAVRPRIGLVLSGGGARGFAHVGVLKALEDARVPVDVVVGTSMGAIIGGLYASGMQVADIEREILKVDWDALFSQRAPRQSLSQRQKEQDFEFSPVLQLGFKDGEFRLPQGAVSSRSLELLLRRYTLPTRNLRSFDELPTRFRAVATDMETGEAVVLRSGDLAAALRASMSVPGLFSPLRWNDRILGDGGLVNNLPVDVARELGVDAVIAVNIGTPLASRDTLDTVLGVTVQMINILTEQNVQRSIGTLTRSDLLLAPPLGTVTAADFDKAEELIGLGHTYAQTVQSSLERFSIPPQSYSEWRETRTNAHQTLQEQAQTRLAFVRIEGVPDNQQPRLHSRIDTQAGDVLDPAKIEADVQRLAATEDFARIDYRLEPAADSPGEGLVYELRDDPWGRNQFRIGLDLQTDFQGQGAFNLRLSHTRRWFNEQGAQWRNQLELGSTIAARTELLQPLGTTQTRFLSAYADYELRSIELFDTVGDPFARFQRHTTRLGLDHGWSLGKAGHWGDVRLGWIGSLRKSIPQYINGIQPGGVRPLEWTESALRLGVVTDQLDHANFPQSGHRFKLDVQAGHTRQSGETTGFLRWDGSITGVLTRGIHTLNAHLRLARSNHVPLGAVDEYSLGGFQNLSGYRVGQIAGNNLMLARLSYYQRLPFEAGPARALFGGATAELGNAWANSRDISWRGLRLGSSVFIGADTAVGPVYLSLVHAPRGYTGVYFLLGRP